MLIGLDKQTLKPTVAGIDYNRLKENSTGKVVISSDGATVPIYDYKLDKEVYISHINITDNVLFNRLTIGVSKGDIGNFLFCYLDISKMGADDTNLIPYTVAGFKAYTDKCLTYIEEHYGIRLEDNNYKGETMEMNVTITLECKFNEYAHLLNLIGDLSTGGRKRYKCYFYKDTDREVSGIKLYSKSRSKKIYDKKRQLNKEKEIEVKIDQEYMRIEDTLLHQNIIVNAFGTCFISDISDEEIKEYMIKSIREDIINPLEKHIEEGNKILKKVAKEEMERDSRKWKRMFLYRAATLKNKKGIPVVVDIKQILDIIKEMNPKHFARDVKKLDKDIEELAHLSNNFTKLEEIKTKCNITD